MASISMASDRKRCAPSPITHGAAPTARTPIAAIAQAREARPPRVMRAPGTGRWPQQHADQEQQMGVERPGVGIEPEPDQLGDTERDAAQHGAPERAEAAEHDHLER